MKSIYGQVTEIAIINNNACKIIDNIIISCKFKPETQMLEVTT